MDFTSLRRSFEVKHRHGHVTAFPTRGDYVTFLRDHGISIEQFTADADLVKEVYLDWLKRGQVGCIFAQLLARPVNRGNVRILVLSQVGSDSETARNLAKQIDQAFHGAVAEAGVEALILLFPRVMDPEALVLIVKSLEVLPDWRIESVLPWGEGLVRFGLRARIESQTWAEILGMGPFPTFLPPTRHCPITSLEIRTKPYRRIRSKLQPKRLRAVPAILLKPQLKARRPGHEAS